MVRLGATVGLYSQVIFPRLCDFLLDRPLIARQRRELLAHAHGDVLEIGFGTGLNLPHYPECVRRITTVDPNCVLLHDDRFLFTGDHLDWDRGGHRLSASEDYCWYSWPEQVGSVRRLADYRFEWVLPGHGQRVGLPAAEMRAEVLRLADSMQRGDR
jgi:hypothetical protein